MKREKPLRIADRALSLALEVQRDIFLEKAERIDNPSVLMGLISKWPLASRTHVPGTKRSAARRVASLANGSLRRRPFSNLSP